jgi:aminopeptidase N
MGTNERKYAWMDEGWAVFLPVLFQNDMAVKNPDVKKDENSEQDIRARNVKAYLRMAGTFYDAPLLVPSNVLKTPSYRHNSYAKAAVVYDILRDMLGDDLFKKALKEYMNRWNGKHPTPYDFFFTFNDASGKNMNWFWQKWFMDYASPDLALKNFKKENNELIITVTNIGELPLPVYLTIKTVEGDTQIIHKSAEIWKYGFSEIAITLPITKEILSIELGSQYVPDLNPENNKLK